VIRVHPVPEVMSEVRLALLEGRAVDDVDCYAYCRDPLGSSGYGVYAEAFGSMSGVLWHTHTRGGDLVDGSGCPEWWQVYGSWSPTRGGGYGIEVGEVLV
jgi:hypothetical protein